VNLAALVTAHAAESPALHDARGWTTWGGLRRRAAAVAKSLQGVGVGPGQRVAIVRPTSVDFVASYLGVLAAGAVAVPLNPHGPCPELTGEIERVSASVVLADAPSAAVLGDDTVGGAQVMAEMPAARSYKLAPADRRPSDPAVLLFTSGTAGAPRPAVLSHGNLVANLRQMLALPGEIARPDDVGFTAIPLFHIFGLNVALGLCLATGSALVLEERFDPATSLALVQDLKVTSLVGVPAMFAAWADQADPADGAMSNVRLAVSGATALPPEWAERFEGRTGVALSQGYGLTEASPVVSTSVGTGRNHPGSVGRPLPGVEVRLVDESGNDVLQGDPGEIWVRGDNVFTGYFEDATATAEVLTGDGWLRTGDVGVLGDEGDLYVVDRRKDLVIVSGFNVYPAEVEQVVRAVAGVADAVAVGRPDPMTGEALEVVVVAAPGGPPVTEQKVRDACASALSRYKCPATVRFVDELPRGLTGKALRRVLREQEPARDKV
jgi:long-chain acyl-CoA synthetase